MNKLGWGMGDRPQWHTETQHPLSDRLIRQGAMLYGVSFGPKTRYALLDIDAHSPYHPNQDPLALRRLLTALEPLGFTRALPVQSSYSGGIHLYLPFAQPQSSSPLAMALQTLLEREGFKRVPGQLELFPDPKPYIPNGIPRNYAAHRLPLQQGSYLLDTNSEPCFSSPQKFVQQWQWCCAGNDLTPKRIQTVLTTYRRRQYALSAKATKFLNDLTTEIEQGWTGHGQTNRLLGRIALRGYIFGHLLYGQGPLEGSDLTQHIAQTAIHLPGYRDWCRHQHEIYKRAEEWAGCVEASRYFHYGHRSSTLSSLPTPTPQNAPLPWNQQQSMAARDRIRQAIAQMLNTQTLPATTTARFEALTAQGLSGTTLYRHRDLWHPHCLHPPAESKPEDPTPSTGRGGEQDSSPPQALSLLGANGCKTPADQAFSPWRSLPSPTGCNAPSAPLEPCNMKPSLIVHESWQQQHHLRQQRQQQAYMERMQQWLTSDDPILMAEAKATLQAVVLRNDSVDNS
ncbi:MAG: hypothetical protein AAFY26_14355 [Cyanobacteria bacterium J06638_22]